MRTWLLISAGLTIVVLAGAVAGAQSSFSAEVTNPGNSMESGTQFASLTDEEGAPMCSSLPAAGALVIPATTDFTCNGTVLPESTDSERSLNLITTGTSQASSATIQGISCLPVSGVNLADPENPVLPRNNAGFGSVPGPKGATALAVTTQMSDAASVVQRKDVWDFTKSIWFRTSLSSPGVDVMGDSSSPDFNGGQFDNYFDTDESTGTVSFHLRPSKVGSFDVTSTTPVTDGNWHFVAVTLNHQAPYTLSLYVDGELEDVIGTGPRVIGGVRYVHLGSRGAGQPVEGAVSNAALWNRSLSALEIRSLFDSEDQASYSDLVMDLGASSYWPLTDDGSTTFDGEITYLDGASPCDYSIFRVWRADHYCIFPNQDYECTETATLADFMRDPITLPPLDLDQNYALTFTAAPVTEPLVAGLRVVIPIRVSQIGFDQTFTIPNNVIQLNE